MNLKKEILAGKIFIYPTDTIYGIGCNALDKKAVKKIRKIKRRDEKPFSIIAPSFKWIKENLIVDVQLKKYLPGPYTLILKKKRKNYLSHVSNTDFIGIRIPNHPFTRKIQKTKIPFVTTSVNLSGEKPANQIKEISPEITKNADYIFDKGKLTGKPSILILNGKEIKR